MESNSKSKHLEVLKAHVACTQVSVHRGQPQAVLQLHPNLA